MENRKANINSFSNLDLGNPLLNPQSIKFNMDLRNPVLNPQSIIFVNISMNVGEPVDVQATISQISASVSLIGRAVKLSYQEKLTTCPCSLENIG